MRYNFTVRRRTPGASRTGEQQLAFERHPNIPGDLAHALWNAARLAQFATWYQPVIDVRTRAIVGAEALLRWDVPGGAVVPAGTFATVAEQIGLLPVLSRHSLAESCNRCAAWVCTSPLELRVNVSPSQLDSRWLVSQVRSALRNSGLAPERLCIEIVETAPLPASRIVLRNLHQLRSIGVRIDLDDFGTGYGSPLYLKHFPVTGIKLDRSFVTGLGMSKRDRIIVGGLVRMARDLGLTVVGEGVETEVQFGELAAVGVEHVQGWLFDPALSPETFVERLAAAPVV